MARRAKVTSAAPKGNDVATPGASRCGPRSLEAPRGMRSGTSGRCSWWQAARRHGEPRSLLQSYKGRIAKWIPEDVVFVDSNRLGATAKTKASRPREQFADYRLPTDRHVRPPTQQCRFERGKSRCGGADRLSPDQ